MVSIKNSELQVIVSAAGAEMQSLCDVATGKEYLWQGDPAYWGGRSPILFPIVGGLWNGECRIGGKAYRIPKHGFVRKRDWEVVRSEESVVTFAVRSTAEERELYPAHYLVEATFSLEGRKVNVEFTVTNEGEEDMWFQLGGHPAFMLHDFQEDVPVSGYWRLEGKPHSLLRAGTQGCIEPDRVEIPLTQDGLVPVCVDTFANEALIFDDHQLTAATLLNTERQPVVRVQSTAPAWLFWAQQGQHCPFVCAEPWYGLCDNQHFEGDISERTYINHLLPGEKWVGGYTVEVF